MSRLLELHKSIMDVTSEDQAKTLVKAWVSPIQATVMEESGEGTKFCSLIAEFVVGFMTRRRVKYMDVVGGRQQRGAEKETNNDIKAKIQAAGGKVIYCAYGGHEFTVVNDRNHYGLFQAWANKFEVFPKLNADAEDHNVIGQGDATLRLILEQIAKIKEKSGSGSVEMDFKAVDIAA